MLLHPLTPKTRLKAKSLHTCCVAKITRVKKTCYTAKNRTSNKYTIHKYITCTVYILYIYINIPFSVGRPQIDWPQECLMKTSSQFQKRNHKTCTTSALFSEHYSPWALLPLVHSHPVEANPKLPRHNLSWCPRFRGISNWLLSHLCSSPVGDLYDTCVNSR